MNLITSGYIYQARSACGDPPAFSLVFDTFSSIYSDLRVQ